MCEKEWREDKRAHDCLPSISFSRFRNEGRRYMDLVVSAGAVVLADRVHDWRTLRRASCRGRLLRVGAPRLGKFLGLSGSVALAGREYFRYGDLSDAFCFLSEADVAVVRRWKSWDLCGPVCGCHVRSAESGGNSRSRNYFAVAFLPVVGAVRADRGDGAIQNGSADGSACRASHRGIRLARRRAGGHVELHGLG